MQFKFTMFIKQILIEKKVANNENCFIFLKYILDSFQSRLDKIVTS